MRLEFLPFLHSTPWLWWWYTSRKVKYMNRFKPSYFVVIIFFESFFFLLLLFPSCLCKKKVENPKCEYKNERNEWFKKIKANMGKLKCTKKDYFVCDCVCLFACGWVNDWKTFFDCFLVNRNYPKWIKIFFFGKLLSFKNIKEMSLFLYVPLYGFNLV